MGYNSNSVLSKLENDHMIPNVTHLRRLALALKVQQAIILDVDGIYEETIEQETINPITDSSEREVTEEQFVNITKEEIIIETPPLNEEVNKVKENVVEAVIFDFEVDDNLIEIKVKEKPFYHHFITIVL